MRELQERLAARFGEVRESRGGPVFFIEHGLDGRERTELLEAVRLRLAELPLEELPWDAHALPLLVAATEVGYRYRGPGTDFWPLLENELRATFGPPARQRVRDFFATAARMYRGAQPPDSPWASAFHLIAWPITHALVPHEFHRPLVTTLANLRVDARALQDADLYGAVLSAAGYVSARFESWLSDPDVVLVVVRHLLGDSSHEVSVDALARIKDDLAGDHVAARALVAAHRRQREVRSATASDPSETRPRLVQGQLLLRRTDGQFVLEARFPRIDAALVDPLRRSLRRRRYAPRLWGRSARVPSEQLLSGLPFRLRLSEHPPEDAELLPALAELGLSREQQATLEVLDLSIRPPILFACSSGGDEAKELRGTDISVSRKYWLLAPREVVRSLKLGGLPVLGDVGPYACVEVAPEMPDAAEAASRLGYRVRRPVSVGFAGAPPVDPEADVPAFSAGDPRLVFLRGAARTTFRLGDDQLEASEGVVRFLVPKGTQALHVANQDESREFRFVGLGQAPPMATSCSVELMGEERTVQALIARALSLRVDSRAPLAGLELTLELEMAGRTASATAGIAPLPQTVGGDAEPWSTLLDEATRQRLLQDPGPVLHARVGGLASGSWPLERRLTPCWWDHSGSTPALSSELGGLALGGVHAARPIESPDPAVEADSNDAVLLVPIDVDLVSQGPAAAFVTCCTAPRRLTFIAPAVRKPRLRRLRRAQGNSVGLEDLAEAYLRWALAESSSLTAEMRRRQVTALLDRWIAELSCGQEWARREVALGGSTSDPWLLLTRTCQKTGLGRDMDVDVSPGDQAAVSGLAVSEIRRTLPELWTRFGPPRDLDEDDYEALDLACGRAYEELAGRYRERGRADVATELELADPGNTADEWDAALLSAKGRAELHSLAELLLPTDSAEDLVGLDYTLVSQHDLLDELVLWSRRAQRALAGGVPDPSVLDALLALVLAPERAVNLDWRSALDTLLAERCVARAVRYVCLRRRDIIGGGES